ncbi:hypothetical protein F183_A01500 [Bryobacterales bacterium F-183]|nr:hypothetical protein F183_A01500 [Bryobacterales bacterium F-183]
MLLPVSLMVAALTSHDLYLKLIPYNPAPGDMVRVEYHNGDSFPNSQVSTKVERLKDARIEGGKDFFQFRIEGTATVADAKAPVNAGNFVAVSRTVPNFIQLDAAKFEEYLKHEGLDEIVAWRKQNGESAKPGREIYSKYAKAIGVTSITSDAYAKPVGFPIEFVPMLNPYEVRPGFALPVQVWFRGKPAAGLTVEASNASPSGEVSKTVVGKTDASGQILIPISKNGLWKLHTIKMERRQDTKEADWESFWCSLTFEVQ